jgi:hypothetical protein
MASQEETPLRCSSPTNEEYDHFNLGEEDRDDFMMRFVDSTCQGIFPGDGGDNSCQSMLPACEAGLDHQLDLLTVRFFRLLLYFLGASRYIFLLATANTVTSGITISDDDVGLTHVILFPGYYVSDSNTLFSSTAGNPWVSCPFSVNITRGTGQWAWK